MWVAPGIGNVKETTVVTVDNSSYSETETYELTGYTVDGQSGGGGGATLVSIAVTPTNPSIAKGTTQQFTATGTYSDSTTQHITTSVTWSSSNTGVATISNASGSNGLASAVDVGTTTITATYGSVSGNTTLTVIPATLVSGVISSNTTWTMAASPYIITGNVGIPSGVILTIEPGVTVYYAGAYYILVKGAIVENGSQLQPISFTSTTASSSGATQLKFQETNLASSQLSYVTFEKAAKAIELYAAPVSYCGSGAGTGPKNSGYLTISNATINASLYTSCESDSGSNGIIVDNSTISSTTVTGAYPWGAKITIQNSIVTNSTLTADSYHTAGITVSNSTVSNATFLLGCCSAKIRLDTNTTVTNSTISEGWGQPIDGPLELSYVQLTNTSANLASAQTTISDSVITYNSSYTGTTRFKVGNGAMSYSRITGNGSGTGLEVTGYSGYSATGGFTISYCDITGHDTGILFSGGSGAFNVSNSNINNNTSYSLKNMKTGASTATNNYWGTTDTATINSSIYDGLDDINYGIVNYTPILNAPQTGTGPR